MSADEIDYMLNAGCPGCDNTDVRHDDLCEHDDETTGPLCPSCCSKHHGRRRMPWEVAAA